MSSDDSRQSESHVTTDADKIREWAAEYDMVPVRRSGRADGRLDLVPSRDAREDDQELSWEAFEEELHDREEVVVRDDTEPPTFSVMDRETVYGQSDAETETIEEALDRGETVTTGFAQTTTVEKTIVEEVTLESELVDNQIVDSTVVDAELIGREVEQCAVDLSETADGDVDLEQFETGRPVTDDLDVSVEVLEDWTLTKEVVEDVIVESRVVDADASEADTTETQTAETDATASSVDTEGVHQTLLQGDLLATESGTVDVDRHAIESEFHEDDRIETNLVERKTVEDEVTVRKEFTGRVTDGETIAVDTTSSRTIESDLVDRDEREPGAAIAGAESGATMDETATGDATMDETTATGDETAATATAGAGDYRITDDDEGKTVVDANGEELGMVVTVEDGTGYVDPHPSLTDRIKATLDWGDPGEDAYPLDESRIDEITDDEVRLQIGE